MALKLGFFESKQIEVFYNIMLSKNQLILNIYILILYLLFAFYIRINLLLGEDVLWKFLLGKYRKPTEEHRIFMFLDLRASTTIAEKLGEERYFNFLKDVYEHATSSILYSRGQIYKYVGDEIIISWKTEKGISNARCLMCFFEIQRTLKDETHYFQETYGVIPEFKAGLHYGYVMAGEIGVVKREIAFTGDVLNTTARIQSKCNELGVDILLSKLLLDKLDIQEKENGYKSKKIGDIVLKGKEQSLVLFTVQAEGIFPIFG